MPKPEGIKTVSTNRRALAKYTVLESIEAGLMLTGPEVKSLRVGEVNLQDGFVRIDQEEAFLMNVHISPYAQRSLHVQQDPTRTRKLLLSKREIQKWAGKLTGRGLAIIPLEIYFNKRGFAKVRLGLAQGKKAPDRRQELKRRTVDRELRREFAGRQKIK